MHIVYEVNIFYINPCSGIAPASISNVDLITIGGSCLSHSSLYYNDVLLIALLYKLTREMRELDPLFPKVVIILNREY